MTSKGLRDLDAYILQLEMGNEMYRKQLGEQFEERLPCVCGFTIEKIAKMEGFTYLPETAEFAIKGLYGLHNWRAAVVIAKKLDNGYKITHCPICRKENPLIGGSLSKIDQPFCSYHRAGGKSGVKRNKTQRVEMVLTLELFERIDKQAKKENLSRSAFCAKILTEAMKG